MKHMRRIVILTAVFVLLLSMFTVTASAQTSKLFSENFSSYKDGEFPDSLIVLAPATLQEVQKKSLVLENQTPNFSTHAAWFDIAPETQKLTLSFKTKVTGGVATLFACGTTSQAVQFRFMSGYILASFGGEYDFMPVAQYTEDTWVRVVAKIDLASNTYDLEIDDVTVAEGLNVSPVTEQDMPLPLLIGMVSEDTHTVVIGDISVKGNVPSSGKKVKVDVPEEYTGTYLIP